VSYPERRWRLFPEKWGSPCRRSTYLAESCTLGVVMLRCTTCGQLPSQPVEGGTRIVCRCGKTWLEFRRPVDVEAIKRLAFAALERARVRVHAVPVAGRPGQLTLSVEREPRAEAGWPEEEARRYADAVNGEADLARAMLQLLAELEQLRARVTPPSSRRGSGTMPRVSFVDLDEEKTG
jgi:hypothetical protein